MIPYQLLQHISLTVAAKLGWDFRENRLADLKRGLLATARESGIGETTAEINDWLEKITWNQHELDTLASHLTVGETYFFREKPWLDVFRHKIIPEIISERKGKDQYIRIWSAGCCSGEEPYTLAILLHEAIPDIKHWHINILATDINHAFLAKARKGSYTEWSFRETPPAIRSRYFKLHGKHWEIDEEIKRMVMFAPLNLADDQYPSMLNNTEHMDIIFCRNVLMYFIPDQIRTVVSRFYHALADKGWFVTSAVESNNDFFTDFNPVKFDQCVVYRKTPGILSKSPNTQLPGSPKSLKQPLPASLKKAVHHIRSTQTPVKKAMTSVKAVIEESEVLAADLYSKECYEQCALMCESLLTKSPGNLNILSLLVRSKANLGLLGEARHWAERLTGHDKVKADHFYLLGTILMEENETALAEQALKRALFLDQHHLMSHFLMGNIATRLAKKQVARKHFQNAMELIGHFEEGEIVPGADGLTAGRIKKILGNLI